VALAQFALQEERRMIVSGKYAGNYIALSRRRVAVVSKNPILVNEKTMVSTLYQDDVQDISIVKFGASGDGVAVDHWLNILNGVGMGDDKIYTIQITWRDGETSIANVTDAQFTKIFHSKETVNPGNNLPESPAASAPVTANIQRESPPNAGTGTHHQTSTNPAKEVEKRFFLMMGMFFLPIGIIGAVLISVVSLLLYGKIYLFDGDLITSMLWIVCFLFIVIGIVGALGAIGNEKASMAVACTVIGIVILCVLFAVGNFFGSIFDGIFGGDGEWDTCLKCGGDGSVVNSLGIEVECPRCNGVGFIP
jgi:hypothetical protein